MKKLLDVLYTVAFTAGLVLIVIGLGSIIEYDNVHHVGYCATTEMGDRYCGNSYCAPNDCN